MRRARDLERPITPCRLHWVFGLAGAGKLPGTLLRGKAAVFETPPNLCIHTNRGVLVSYITLQETSQTVTCIFPQIDNR